MIRKMCKFQFIELFSAVGAKAFPFGEGGKNL